MAAAQHVWVRDPANPVEMPGVLVEWRRTESAAPPWWARVVYVDGRINGHSKVVDAWLPATWVAKATGRGSTTGSAYD